MDVDNDTAVVIGAFIAGVALLIGENGEEEQVQEVFEGGRRRLQPIHSNANGFRNLEDKTFKEHFRMNRSLFEVLLLRVGNHLEGRGRIQRLRTPLDVCLMMSLWILATQDSFRSVAVKFGIPSRGTVHYHFVSVVEALREMAPQFIQWPDEFERDTIKSCFERKYGYPGVVGCIDGTHIYISSPLFQAARYVNRFKKTSLLLQAVCDHNMVFRDIYVGQPGSVHDSRMFQRSPLSNNLLHNREMLSPDEHILGDGAYTLTDKVITPYRNMGNLNRTRRHHNFKHASTRASVERAFGYSKGKWRRQKGMLSYSLSYAIDTVVASCVLHNFILLNGRPYVDRVENHANLVDGFLPDEGYEGEDDIAEEEYLADNPVNEEGNNVAEDAIAEEEYLADNPVIIDVHDPVLTAAKRAGRRKRDFIAHLLTPDN